MSTPSDTWVRKYGDFAGRQAYVDGKLYAELVRLRHAYLHKQRQEAQMAQYAEQMGQRSVVVPAMHSRNRERLAGAEV